MQVIRRHLSYANVMATGGDVPGDPNTQARTVKLIKKA